MSFSRIVIAWGNRTGGALQTLNAPLHTYTQHVIGETVLISRNLVGRCGLYCGACSIYRAHKDGGGYLKTLSNHFKCPPEKIRCEGCMALTPECWGNECKIVQCLRTKSLDYCYQCSQYEDNSCEKFENIASGYLEDGEDVHSNLERIKKGETDEWLRECKQTYRCRVCGKPLPVGRMKKKCYHCGADLSIVWWKVLKNEASYSIRSCPFFIVACHRRTSQAHPLHSSSSTQSASRWWLHCTVVEQS